MEIHFNFADSSGNKVKGVTLNFANWFIDRVLQYKYYGEDTPDSEYIDCEYNCVIDWGDNSQPITYCLNSEGFDDSDSSILSHTYTNGGYHVVTITGVCDALQMCGDIILYEDLDNPGANVDYRDYGSATNKVGNIGTYCTGLYVPESKLFTSPLKYVPGAFYGFGNMTFVSRRAFENCTEARSFSHTFDCAGIKYIFTDWFANCPNLQRIDYCFNSFTGTWLPKNLLKNNPKLTNIDHSFDHSVWIKEIPTGFFDNNTEIMYATSAFRDCTSLTYLPSDFMQYCTKLKEVDYLFAYSSAHNKGWDGARNMSIMGNLIPFWDMGFPITNHTNCYYGCTLASNYYIAEANSYT